MRLAVGNYMQKYTVWHEHLSAISMTDRMPVPLADLPDTHPLQKEEIMQMNAAQIGLYSRSHLRLWCIQEANN